MSATTMRFYRNTLAHQSMQRERRVRDFHKRLRVRLSRRRFKQSLRTVLSRINS